MTNQELIQTVTQRIIEQLKNGVKPWECAWNRSGGGFALPHNPTTHESYHGINIPILWEAANRMGYTTNLWLGFSQAKALGGHIKKDEKGTRGIFYKPIPVEDQAQADGKRMIPLLKSFVVFNLDQIAGVDHLYPKPLAEDHTFQPIQAAEELLKMSGARLVEGGPNAFYRKSEDLISLPDRFRFDLTENFYATGLHELTHWTGHPSRLDRQTGKRFGDHAYAFEELIAEMGSAFLCAHLGLKGELQHENYIGSWLTILKEDYRVLVSAASQAQKAFEYLDRLLKLDANKASAS